MPAAETRNDLIDVTEKEFAALSAVMAMVPPEAALAKDADDTSIKDVIAHRVHWIDLFLGWYSDGQAGREVSFPAPGYKWNDLKRYNADLRARQRDMDWDAACVALMRAHKRLSEWMSALDDPALYGGPMKGANNNWTPGRWVEAAGPSHYRSATKYLRKRLKEAPAPTG